MISIDQLLATLFQDVAESGKESTPGAMVQRSLSGQLPQNDAPMALPMALGGPRRSGGIPMPGPPPVPGPRAPNVGIAPSRPVQVAQGPTIPGNPLTDFSQGYRSGGLIGAIGNLMQAPEMRQAAQQQFQRQQAEAAANQNMTIRALQARDPNIDPNVAAVIARDPKLLQEYLSIPDPTKGMTSDQKEYLQAKQQGFQGTFMDYQTAIKKAGAPSTTITNDLKGEGKFLTKLGEIDATTVGKVMEKADAAQGQLDDLALMRGALRDYQAGSKLGTGILAPIEMNIRNLARQFNIGNADTVAAGDLVSALGKKMALFVRNPESGLGMPGALSERDIQFLKATMPGIETTAAGNELIIDVYSRLQRRKIEVAKLMDAYARQNNGLGGWAEYLDKWTKANPIVDDQTAAALTAKKSEATGGSQQGGTGVFRKRWNPATGALE